ncbi:MAG: low molecular weight phosphatase family protein [Actinomycetia bacterium]|nr:low molecular weight phosphatase family protein [Actinomycetes bacterium]
MVCTGNICRSPAAERWLARLGDDSVSVSSAGIAAVVGAPIPPDMAWLLEQAGLSADGHGGRQLTPATIRASDLILTMTTEHRRWVVGRVPEAVRRTFTLVELARVARLGAGAPCGPTTADRLRGLVAAAPRARAQLHLADDGFGAGLDVPDPFGRGMAASEHAFSAIRAAVAVIAGPPAG